MTVSHGREKEMITATSQRIFFAAIFFALSILMVATQAFAEKKQLAQLEYPELMVTPLASERLAQEARREMRGQHSIYAPFYVSSFTTLMGGVFQLAEPVPTGWGEFQSNGQTSEELQDRTNQFERTKKRLGVVGVAVGGGFLLTNALLHLIYEPFQSGFASAESMPATTERELLARERAAEAELEKAARIGNRFKWLSVGANFAASLIMISDTDSRERAHTPALMALGASLAPLFFPPRWDQVNRQQQRYKKQIYRPVADFNLFPQTVGSKTHWEPGVQLSLHF
jgi:hypothetical protein